MKSNEIEEEQALLQKQMDELEKQKKEVLVDEGKAYFCEKCKAFVDKECVGAGPKDRKLCSMCFRRGRQEEKKKDMLETLRFARIVNIEMEGSDISVITVHKDGVLYDLQGKYDRDDGGDAVIAVVDTHRDVGQCELEPGEQKPWKKERKEKPLDVPSCR